jgi:hypothetical protein
LLFSEGHTLRLHVHLVRTAFRWRCLCSLVEWYWQNSEVLEVNPVPVPFRVPKSHMDGSGIEPRLTLWEARD